MVLWGLEEKEGGVTVYWEFQFRKKKGSWQWMGEWAHHSVNVL